MSDREVEPCTCDIAVCRRCLNRVDVVGLLRQIETIRKERDEARLEAKAATEVAIGYFLEYRKYDRKWGLAVVSAEKQRLIYEWKELTTTAPTGKGGGSEAHT